MNCAGDDTLRAWIDDELSVSERDRVQEHVRSCSKCGERASRMRGNAQEVQSWMNQLASTDEQAINARLAYRGYEAVVVERIAWWRAPQIGAAGSVLALILLLTFTPARTWGQHFLQMLRVQKLAVVPVDSSVLTRTGMLGGHAHALSQLISDSVVVTMKPGDSLVVPDVASAAAKVGFAVEALDGLGAPQRIEVEDEGAFHMTLDSERIRAVLEEAGRSDIAVPDSINGSTVAVHVSKGVNLRYGNCGEKNAVEDTCVQVMEVPSPTVSVPPNLDMGALAEAGLQLAGLSAAEAKSFAQTVDWTSTLVIPVPQDKATYRTVPVEGVNGTLIEWPQAGAFREAYALIWVKNGVVHAVNGHGSPGRALAAVANLGS